MAYAQSKEHAHELIDRMAPGQIIAVVSFMEMMLEPLAKSLANAPWDDEPVSEEEAQAILAATASLDRGEGVSHEEVLAEFGLKSGDFERLGQTPIEY